MITRVRTEKDYTWNVRQKIMELVQSLIEARNRGCKAVKKTDRIYKQNSVLGQGIYRRIRQGNRGGRHIHISGKRKAKNMERQ
jgi:hypothetical protein